MEPLRPSRVYQPRRQELGLGARMGRQGGFGAFGGQRGLGGRQHGLGGMRMQGGLQGGRGFRGFQGGRQQNRVLGFGNRGFGRTGGVASLGMGSSMMGRYGGIREIYHDPNRGLGGSRRGLGQ